MQVEWYGQSAFRLSADGTTVFIDPSGDVSALASRMASVERLDAPRFGTEQLAGGTRQVTVVPAAP